MSCAYRCLKRSWNGCAPPKMRRRPGRKALRSRRRWWCEYGNWCREFNSALRLDAIPWQSKLRKQSVRETENLATDLIEIDPDQPDPEAIERAAAHLRRGDVVAIPTEALYMLVADPLNLNAVGRVFAAKGREVHRALPLLIGGVYMAEDLAKELSTRFHVLARH